MKNQAEKYFCFLIEGHAQVIRVRGESVEDYGDGYCVFDESDKQVAWLSRVLSWWQEWRGRHHDDPPAEPTHEPVPERDKEMLRSIHWGSYQPGRQWRLGDILHEAGLISSKRSSGYAKRHGQALYDFLDLLGFDRRQLSDGKWPKWTYVWNAEG